MGVINPENVQKTYDEIIAELVQEDRSDWDRLRHAAFCKARAETIRGIMDSIIFMYDSMAVIGLTHELLAELDSILVESGVCMLELMKKINKHSHDNLDEESKEFLYNLGEEISRDLGVI